MNIYVETNFVLELAFEQEQSESCEQILKFAEIKKIKLIIPAYSLAEPHEKLNRQAKNRKKLQNDLNIELRQLSRSKTYMNRLESIRDLAKLIAQSNEEEWQRFIQYRHRLLNCAEFITLDKNILRLGASFENLYNLQSQDAIVFASVIFHLQQNNPNRACFLNKNSKDFDNPDIVRELKKLNCRMIPRFDRGLDFIRSQL